MKKLASIALIALMAVTGSALANTDSSVTDNTKDTNATMMNDGHHKCSDKEMKEHKHDRQNHKKDHKRGPVEQNQTSKETSAANN